jgi:hypothetical protein
VSGHGCRGATIARQHAAGLGQVQVQVQECQAVARFQSMSSRGDVCTETRHGVSQCKGLTRPDPGITDPALTKTTDHPKTKVTVSFEFVTLCL